MERIDLLKNAIWTNKDIMEYVGCGATKAVEIRKSAVFEHKGLIPMCPKKVYRDAVLRALGLDFRSEIEKYKLVNQALSTKPTDESL